MNMTENSTKPSNENAMSADYNPVGLDGMEFIEYASPAPGVMEEIFDKLGFVKVGTHRTKKVTLYRQNGINYILNQEVDGFAQQFKSLHGPSICATGFRVQNAEKAMEAAIKRGAKKYEGESHTFPAIYGIGDSLIYFIDNYHKEDIYDPDFEFVADKRQKGFGLLSTDHMTNNVPAGDMQTWCDFYKDIFNFSEVRFFDIQGKDTGLISKVMRSPCKKITIPINEPTDSKSQIQEYIDEYKGSGIQHVALLTNNIVGAVEFLKEKGVKFLDVPDTYYDNLKTRLPGITEDIADLKRLKILVDGDSEGYLLQIFTQNMVGPIFYEIIQRKGHDGFGEGNFQALFDAIEADQRRRGVLQ